MKKIYYYDDFDSDVVKSKNQDYVLKDNYKLVNKNIFYVIWSYVIYGIFLIISFVYIKLFLHVRIKNRKVLKNKKNYYLYINHTQEIGDAFIPPFITRYKRPYYVVNKANLGIPVLGKLLPTLGALVIPDGIHDMVKFREALKYYGVKHPVVIYPEAHVWPYYTKIRPFKNSAFQLAVEDEKEVYCATATYQKSKIFKKPKIVVYVDGPFCVDNLLTKKEKSKELAEIVRDKMVERSKMSNVEYVIYKKKDN